MVDKPVLVIFYIFMGRVRNFETELVGTVVTRGLPVFGTSHYGGTPLKNSGTP